MQNGAISDGQVSASTSYDDHLLAASQGRLHKRGEGLLTGSWESSTIDTRQWLQVDLLSYYTKINGVATQGRARLNHRVTTYNLKYSDFEDEIKFRYFMEQGQSVKKVTYRNRINKQETISVMHAT